MARKHKKEKREKKEKKEKKEKSEKKHKHKDKRKEQGGAWTVRQQWMEATHEGKRAFEENLRRKALEQTTQGHRMLGVLCVCKDLAVQRMALTIAACMPRLTITGSGGACDDTWHQEVNVQDRWALAIDRGCLM